MQSLRQGSARSLDHASLAVVEEARASASPQGGAMATELSETQRQILTTASGRKSGLVLPVASNLKGGALKKVLSALLTRGARRGGARWSAAGGLAHERRGHGARPEAHQCQPRGGRRRRSAAPESP